MLFISAMAKIRSATDALIEHAAQILRDGGLVAFPTETVYGLGAHACDEDAVAKIFTAKGRPSFNPLIVHVAHMDQAAELVEMDSRAKTIATHFWPGPITLVLPQKQGNGIAGNVSAGLPTLAVRIPAHEVARKLLSKAAIPVAAPSANKSGNLSPTRPTHVAEGLGDAVDVILAAGACDVGVESSVLDLSTDVPTLLRPGGITREMIADALGCDVALLDMDAIKDETDGQPKSPGMLLKHYAPKIPVRLNAVDVEPGEALLAFGSLKFMGIKGGGRASDLPDSAIRNLSESQDLHEAASNLFAMMRALDLNAHKAIAVMNIPDHGIGCAINDRLRRAAAG